MVHRKDVSTSVMRDDVHIVLSTLSGCADNCSGVVFATAGGNTMHIVSSCRDVCHREDPCAQRKASIGNNQVIGCMCDKDAKCQIHVEKSPDEPHH